MRSALDAQASALTTASRIFLIGFGKAAVPMTVAALPFVVDRLAGAVVVTNRENSVDLPGVSVITGGHPLPDEGSIAGAQAVEALAEQAGPGDLVLVLVSGGGSALLCAPVDGLILADKIALNEALIKSGADIGAINTVRTALSRLKGGGLARKAAPAKILSLILSDVPGDDLATIASGPTVPREGSSAEHARQAQNCLAQHGLAGAMPAIEAALRRKRDAQPITSEKPETSNLLIGSNALSVAAMIETAHTSGLEVDRPPDWLVGDVADAAAFLHERAQSASGSTRPTAILCGGETTVRVRGKGLGGRNQELALRFACLEQAAPLGRPWVFLSGGTDGRDGPTDAAGGVVDAATLRRIKQAGRDAAAQLADNDAYHALDAAGDLLRIGATGTNVADLQILLLG